MAREKEPSYFNNGNNGSLCYKLQFDGTMNIFIETLTGIRFELRVSPFETVVSLKAKIHTLQGIPVSQQHLIWNNVELEDTHVLNDYNISEGCTLKLIPAMRGGPINTRRVALESSLRELSEYMNSLQGEMSDKKPSNGQIRYVAYREGRKLTLLRVVDKGDGTLTPLDHKPSATTASRSEGSVNNPEDKASSSGQQIMENSITKNKMKLLKLEMDTINFNKKPKMPSVAKPWSPQVLRPSTSIASARPKSVRVLPRIGQSCLPPENSLESSHNALSTLTAASRTIPSITGDCLTENDTWNTSVLAPSHNSFGLPPKISRVELENTRPRKNILLPPISPLPKKEGLTTENDTIFHPNLNLFSAEENTRPIADSFAFVTEGGPTEQYGELYNLGKANTDFGIPEGCKESPTAETHHKTLSTALNSEAMETGVMNTGELSTPRNKFLSPIHFPAQMTHNSNSHHQPRCFEFGSLRPTASHSLFRSLEIRNIADPSFSRTRFQGVKVDTPGNRSDILSKMGARDITELANTASKEPVGTLKNLEFFASLARYTSRDNLQSSSNTDTHSAVPCSTSQQYSQEDSFITIETLNDNADLFMHPYGVRVDNAATDETAQITPSAKTIRLKKKATKRCLVCGKKTGLATSYECRCGSNFCATHRYPETHNCSYDYKAAGRSYLEETNPVITAPKLPKI